MYKMSSLARIESRGGSGGSDGGKDELRIIRDIRRLETTGLLVRWGLGVSESSESLDSDSFLWRAALACVSSESGGVVTPNRFIFPPNALTLGLRTGPALLVGVSFAACPLTPLSLRLPLVLFALRRCSWVRMTPAYGITNEDIAGSRVEPRSSMPGRCC